MLNNLLDRPSLPLSMRSTWPNATAGVDPPAHTLQPYQHHQRQLDHYRYYPQESTVTPRPPENLYYGLHYDATRPLPTGYPESSQRTVVADSAFPYDANHISSDSFTRREVTHNADGYYRSGAIDQSRLGNHQAPVEQVVSPEDEAIPFPMSPCERNIIPSHAFYHPVSVEPPTPPIDKPNGFHSPAFFEESSKTPSLCTPLLDPIQSTSASNISSNSLGLRTEPDSWSYTPAPRESKDISQDIEDSSYILNPVQALERGHSPISMCNPWPLTLGSNNQEPSTSPQTLPSTPGSQSTVATEALNPVQALLERRHSPISMCNSWPLHLGRNDQEPYTRPQALPSTLGSRPVVVAEAAPPSSYTRRSSSIGTRKKTRRHECGICGKTFPRPSGLNTHMNAHNGVKPFLCEFPQCKRRFTVRSNAKRHLKTHGIIVLPISEPQPVPYAVSFEPPQVSSYTPHHDLTRVPMALRWIPQSLSTRTNAMTLQQAFDSESGSDEDDQYEDTRDAYAYPSLSMPLRAVVPSSPRLNPLDQHEERNSYMEAGSYPYHSSQFRGLPGPAAVLPRTRVAA